jgi:hypothetical protein
MRLRLLGTDAIAGKVLLRDKLRGVRLPRCARSSLWPSMLPGLWGHPERPERASPCARRVNKSWQTDLTYLKTQGWDDITCRRLWATTRTIFSDACAGVLNRLMVAPVKSAPDYRILLEEAVA